MPSPTSSPPPPPVPCALPPAAHWAAMHTRARAEKVVAEWVQHEGGTAWIPLARSRRVYGARVRESWVPLFPGYVFYDSATYDGRRAYRSQRVAAVLVPPLPEVLGDDLQNVARALAATPDLRPGEAPLEPGQAVQVVSGPLEGTRGRLLRREGQTVLVIAVSFLGFGAEVTIDEAWVRAA